MPDCRFSSAQIPVFPAFSFLSPPCLMAAAIGSRTIALWLMRLFFAAILSRVYQGPEARQMRLVKFHPCLIPAGLDFPLPDYLGCFADGSFCLRRNNIQLQGPAFNNFFICPEPDAAGAKIQP